MQLDKLAGCSQSEIKGSSWMSWVGVQRHFKMVKIADALSVTLKKKSGRKPQQYISKLYHFKIAIPEDPIRNTNCREVSSLVMSQVLLPYVSPVRTAIFPGLLENGNKYTSHHVTAHCNELHTALQRVQPSQTAMNCVPLHN
jgi:hypothetical protein